MMKNRFQLRTVVLLLLVIVTLFPTNAKSYHWMTDLNGDGVVDVSDVTTLISVVLNGGDAEPAINPSVGYISAKSFGAVGDGVTDDTEALEKLFEAAFECNKAVFFDPGVYLIRRSLTLRTGMEVYGENATITKKKAVSTNLTADAVKDQTYLDVASTNGFNVGDQFFIADAAGANYCTYGIITEIEGNRIKFTNIISDSQPNFPGCIRNYASGLEVSTSFALLRSWTPRFECDGVYIHDLTLDGNRVTSEAKSWANSCIHLDSYFAGGYTGSTGIEYRTIQRNLMVRNVIIKNSSHDAISDQGEGGLIVRDCLIENPAIHGVHLGTVYADAIISNNTMVGSGTNGSGVFFCQDVTNVLVDNNMISSFNFGCSDQENGTCGKFITIRNNTFSNLRGYVFNFLKAASARHGGGLMITNNNIEGLKSMLFCGGYLDNVIISNNQVLSVAKAPSTLIKATNSNAVVVVGNSIPSDVTISTPVNSSGSTNTIDSSNSWN